MKIISVDIDLASDKFKPITRSKYQFISMYLTLLISDWIKKLELDLGSFNRLIFEEGHDDDFSVVGDRAFIICLSEDFEEIEKLTNAKDVHAYFVRKYIEGFERFDKKFNIFLTKQLRLLLDKEFSSCFEYEKKVKSKKIGDTTVQVIHRYKYDIYELLVRVFNKDKETIKEDVIFTCDPDPFVVHYDINKVEINNDKVRVLNKIGEETLVYDL